MENLDNFGVSSYVSNNSIIITISVSLYENVLSFLQKYILDETYKNLKKSNIKGLILDISNIEIIDYYELQELTKILKVSLLFGLKVFIVGLKTENIMSLLDFNSNFLESNNINYAISIERALETIK